MTMLMLANPSPPNRVQNRPSAKDEAEDRDGFRLEWSGGEEPLVQNHPMFLGKCS